MFLLDAAAFRRVLVVGKCDASPNKLFCDDVYAALKI